MAQFRTTSDILDEILQKAGEPTNGNSQFEARALTYANKVHHAIIGGGNIFNLNVDEPWVWARSRAPIVLELLPAYSTGSAACTLDDVAVVLSAAPTDSLEGWHFQINGTGTVYKIMQHTAGAVTMALDSAFVDTSGSYNFRAFKLDYEIFPSYMYVDNSNDRVDYMEGTAATVSATLTHGSYTPANLISHIANRLQAAGSKTYSGTYDTVLRKFALTQTGTTFTVLPVTGTNFRRNGMSNVGFDILDYTGAQTYTSTYTPNQVARLIEPFKLFATADCEPFIYSTDPIKMQEDYPISLTRERTPDRFIRLSEDSSGIKAVRFNGYPTFKTKVQIDWIPQPADLQDNRASIPALPRADVDTLIHGAAAFISYDKEDSKWEGFLGLCKAGLDALKKKNHGELFRTGKTFGQIVPRLDMAYREKHLRYGYTSSGSGTGTTASTTNILTAVTMSYTLFQIGNTAAAVLARTLSSSRVLNSLLIKNSLSFAGGAITTISCNVGTTASATQFINAFNPMQAAGSQDSFLGLYYPAADTAINVQLISVGANLSALTSGELILYFQESIVP